jgi:hypothetical protein
MLFLLLKILDFSTYSRMIALTKNLIKARILRHGKHGNTIKLKWSSSEVAERTRFKKRRKGHTLGIYSTVGGIGCTGLPELENVGLDKMDDLPSSDVSVENTTAAMSAAESKKLDDMIE